MNRLIHTEKTRADLARARAAHAVHCTKVVTACIICREHFRIERRG